MQVTTLEADEVKTDEITGLDEEDNDFTLISKKNPEVKFEINRSYLNISKVIKTSISHDDDKSLELNIEPKMLELVVEYMNIHKGEEPKEIKKPLQSDDISKAVSAEDAEFINKLSRQECYDIIHTANYLGINSLLNLGCAKIASLLKGQPISKIPEILDTKN